MIAHKLYDGIMFKFLLIFYEHNRKTLRKNVSFCAFATVNQIYHYTCCITPNRVTNTASDLTGSRFEPQTSLSRDERVAA